MAAQFAMVHFHMEGDIYDIIGIESIESIEGHESVEQPFERDDSKEFIVNWMDSKPYPAKVLAISGIAFIVVY